MTPITLPIEIDSMWRSFLIALARWSGEYLEVRFTHPGVQDPVRAMELLLGDFPIGRASVGLGWDEQTKVFTDNTLRDGTNVVVADIIGGHGVEYCMIDRHGPEHTVRLELSINVSTQYQDTTLEQLYERIVSKKLAQPAAFKLWCDCVAAVAAAGQFSRCDLADEGEAWTDR